MNQTPYTERMRSTERMRPAAMDRKTAAEYLSISIRMLDHLARQKRIQKIMIGRKPVFLAKELDQFLETCKAQ